MLVTKSQGHDWRLWTLLTSIALIQLDQKGLPINVGCGTMLDHAGFRYILSVEHVVKQGTSGWAVVVQQEGNGQLEYHRPNMFSYVGEFRRSTTAIRLLDLCVAKVPPSLNTWFENRTPRGLFDKRPHHVFSSDAIATPDPDQIYGFAGHVRTEQHGANVFVSDMVVYPGLVYSHSQDEFHFFKLPVNHPGHDAFYGCSGAPIVDFNRKLVAIVVGGDVKEGTIHGIAIQRVLPNLEFLESHGRGA